LADLAAADGGDDGGDDGDGGAVALPAAPAGTLPPTLPEQCGALPGGAFAEAVETWLHGAGERAVTAARVLA
ncbi:hypothetical protein VR45_03150, partial [Streptomyces sp. NRRL S-495]